jgi:hypothetical protein
MRPIHLWRSRTPDGVRFAHFPSVITTIMDHKVQLIKPFNLGELYTVYQNRLFAQPFLCYIDTIDFGKSCALCITISLITVHLQRSLTPLNFT